MTAIPKEFQDYAHYFYSGLCLEPINKSAAIVLYHVFIDSCKEIDSSTEETKNFIKLFTEKLPKFPVDGPREVEFVANELYGALQEKLSAGIINSHMPDQFVLCSVLYSIVEGEQAMSREIKCHLACSKLIRLLQQVTPPKKEEDAKPEAENEENKEIIEEQPQKEDVQERVYHIDVSKPILQQPQLGESYNATEIRQYFKDIGIPIQSGITHPTKVHQAIQKNLDLGASCIKNGDRELGLSYLRTAQKIWATGVPQ